jgi:hypothetical protein
MRCRMNIYKVIIDNEHSYKIKGDGIDRFGDEMIAEIYRKDKDGRFTTLALVNLTNIVGIFCEGGEE